MPCKLFDPLPENLLLQQEKSRAMRPFAMDDNDDDSQFIFCPSNFSNFTIYQRKMANISYTVTGAAGLTLATVLLCLLILYRAFKTTLQRLFLYFTAVVGVTDVIQVLNVELQFKKVDEEFCSWLGFLGQWLELSYNILAIGLVVYVSLLTCRKIWPKKIDPLFKKVTKKCLLAMEVLYLFVAVVGPAAGFAVLLKEHKYGLSESVCWLRVHNRDCTKSSRDALYLGSQFMVIFRFVLMVVIMFLIVTLHVTIMKYQQNREVVRDNACRASFLVAVMWLSMLAKLGETVVSVINFKTNLMVHQFYYTLIDEIVQTFTNNLLLYGLAVYLYSPKKLRLASVKKELVNLCTCSPWCTACCKCHCFKSARRRAERRAERRVTWDAEQNTFTNSVCDNTPSHTTYSSPYTNEFTEITEILSCGQDDKYHKYGATN